MPYARSYRRRNYRYNRRRLSNRNVFNKTSAKSQARQIATLRNRINAVARNNRPETQLHTGTAGATFNNSEFSATYQNWVISLPGNSMTGQWVHSKGLSLRGLFEYSDNYQNVVAADHQRTCTFRIIIYAKLVSNSTEIAVADILDLSNSGRGYELNAVKPLKKGITSYLKIYYDKSYTISAQNPIRKININLKKLLNLHKETSDEHPRGEIGFSVITSGLHWDNSYTQELRLNFISTYAYQDVN